jgi:DNA-binding NtrC family response regulator
MNTIYHSLRKSDLVEAIFELRNTSSELLKVFTGTDLPEFQTFVLSLRQTYPEIIEIIEEYGKCNPEKISPDAIEEKKNQLDSIKEVRIALEEYFGKSGSVNVIVLGPYKDELEEIKMRLDNPGSETDLQNHFFLFGESLEPSLINKLRLSHKSDLSGPQETKFKNIYVLYNKLNFSEEYFEHFPESSFFYPAGIESKYEEVKSKLEDALGRIDKACSLEPKTFEDILTSNRAYEKTKTKALIFSKIDRPILIIGNTSFERENLARLIHNERLDSKTGKFTSLNTTLSPLKNTSDVFSNLVSFIFPLYGVYKILKKNIDEENDSELEIIKRNVKEGTLFIDNVDSISEDNQRYILQLVSNKLSKSSSPDDDNGSKLKLIFGARSRARLSRIIPNLKFAISDVILDIPTLQERGCEDIKRNTFFLVEQINQLLMNREGKPEDLKISFGITEYGLEKMCDYAWPGNDGELSTFVKNAFTKAATDIISRERSISLNGNIIVTENDILEMINERKPVENPVEASPIDANSSENEFSHLYKVDLSSVHDLERFLNQIEKDYLEMAIRKYGKVQTKIGRALGYTQPKVFRRMKTLGIK